MKTPIEIRKIAKNESQDEDSQSDINDKSYPRIDLWVSAFYLGYKMGQAGVERYTDLL